MVLNNNLVPLILIIIVIGVVLGMALTGIGPFNQTTVEYNVQVKATDHAFQANATQVAFAATQTPLAWSAQQTAIVDQLTAIPIQQAATQVVELVAVENAQLRATQTSIAGDAINNQLADQATQTAIAGNQQRDAQSAGATTTAMAESHIKDQATRVTSFAVISIVTLTICCWIVAHVFVQTLQAHAQEKIAQAQFLAEQRRMLSIRASLQNHNGHKPDYPVPNSLMRNLGDVDKMAKEK